MQRRSSNRAHRKKYTVDAFASIPELRDEEDTPADRVQHSDDADDAFNEGAEPGASNDDEVSNGEATPDENEDEEFDEEFEDTPSSRRRGRRKPIKPFSEDTPVTRGVVDTSRFHVSASKAARKIMYWGGAREDQLLAQKSFDRWSDFPILPGEGTFHEPFDTNKEEYKQSVDDDWSWCCDLPEAESVLNKQEVSMHTREEVQHLLPTADRAFVMGAISNPRRFALNSQQSAPLDAAFSRSRSGVVINTGARVQSLDWVPHQPGAIQYLAVSTASERSDFPPFEAPTAPAYNPTSQYQTLIQIWRINTKDNSEARLKALLSTSYGDARRLQFCPHPARSHGQTPRLLGCLFSDGGLRVMILPHITTGDDSDVYHISRPVLESIAVSSMYSCFTWVSPRRIAAGCANGCIALFDLKDALLPERNVRPRKFAAVSPTYILDITSCSPSCANLVLTISMDGYLRLTDITHSNLSSPAATVHGSRIRTALTKCVWHIFARSAIIADDTFGVRLHLVRRIFNVFTVGRMKSAPTIMAVSHCHPFLLVGTAAGDVQSMNPLIKVFDTKSSAWQQTWFSHEWRRGGHQDAGGDLTSQHIAKEGLSRFTEGYKSEKMTLSKVSGGDGMPGGYLTNTVYEKKSAVTALAWNPNLHAGGWAAAGLGDGLLRVEDIALPAR